MPSRAPRCPRHRESRTVFSSKSCRRTCAFARRARPRRRKRRIRSSSRPAAARGAVRLRTRRGAVASRRARLPKVAAIVVPLIVHVSRASPRTDAAKALAAAPRRREVGKSPRRRAGGQRRRGGVRSKRQPFVARAAQELADAAAAHARQAAAAHARRTKGSQTPKMRALATLAAAWLHALVAHALQVEISLPQGAAPLRFERGDDLEAVADALAAGR